jgi:recombination protein RecA
MAPPFKQAEFDILYGLGISREGDILDLAQNFKLLSNSGTWYSYGETRLGQGRENARQFLKENAEVAAEIENRIREACSLPRLERKAAIEEAK